MQVSRPHQLPVGRPTARKSPSDNKCLIATSNLRSHAGRRHTLSFDLKPSSGSLISTPAAGVSRRKVNASHSHSRRRKVPRGCMAADQDNNPQNGDDKNELPLMGIVSDSEGSQTDGSSNGGDSVGGGYARRPSMERNWHGTMSSGSDSPELRAILNRAPSMRRRSASEESLNPPSPSSTSTQAKVNFTGRRAASYGMRAGRGGFSGSFDSRGSSVSSTPEGSTHNGVLYSSLPSQPFETLHEEADFSDLEGTDIEDSYNGGIIGGTVYLSDWVVDPRADWYMSFQQVLLLLSVLSGVLAPFNIAFLNAGEVGSPLSVALYAIDAVFIFDMALSFFVAEFRQGDWKTSLTAIAQEYTKGVFWLDLAAAVPWDLVLRMPLMAVMGLSPMQASIFGLTRMLRMYRLWDYLWDLAMDSHYSHFLVSCMKLTLLTLYSLHVSACVFFLLARLHSFDVHTWVAHCAPEIISGSVIDAYVTSLYWSITTLSTTGYGDMAAYTRVERMWTTFFMLFNLALTAYVLGNITVLLTKADAAAAVFRDRLAAVNRYMRAHSVPEHLQGQVQEHLKLHFDTSEIRDDVLQHCPPSVRAVVARHVHARHIDSAYLFQDTSQVFRDTLTSLARVEFFLPQVELAVAGSSISEMYIIASGQAEVLVKDGGGNEVAWFTLQEGDCVGEVAFLCGIAELWTIRTMQTCRLLSIPRNGYRSLSRAHPSDDRQVVANLLERVKLRADNCSHIPHATRLVADLSALLKHEVEAFKSRQSQETVTSLCYAAKRGDIVELYRLAAGGFDLNMADYDGRTPLHLAAAGGQDRTLLFLLERGANPNAEDAFFRTPLQEAVAAGHVSAAHLLRSHGGELRLRNEGMHMCRVAASGSAAEMQRLLEFGADPNASDYDGRTPLHIAAAEGHLSVVKVLLQGSANPSQLDRWQRTAAEEARDSRHEAVAALIASAGSGREGQGTGIGSAQATA